MSLTVNYEHISRVFITFILLSLYIKLLNEINRRLEKCDFLNSLKLYCIEVV